MRQSPLNVDHVQLGFFVQVPAKVQWNVRMDIIAQEEHHNVLFVLMDTGKHISLNSFN